MVEKNQEEDYFGDTLKTTWNPHFSVPTGEQPHSLICLLSEATFTLQMTILGRDTAWPTKPKVFTNWPFVEKVSWPLTYYRRDYTKTIETQKISTQRFFLSKKKKKKKQLIKVENVHFHCLKESLWPIKLGTIFRKVKIQCCHGCGKTWANTLLVAP